MGRGPSWFCLPIPTNKLMSRCDPGETPSGVLMSMNATILSRKNPQQVFVGRGIKTVAIFGSAAGQVAVHEDPSLETPARYFISVDGKLRKEDAIGYPGGIFLFTHRAETTLRAKKLVEKANQIATRIARAEVFTGSGADLLLRRHRHDWERLIGPYSCEVMP